ncbi:alpha,alpha-trehalose-phosphate synthase [UDP-forming]-like [Daphnia pulex]|uniref:alpha,alpha-trehalose-phosphate synthase [UDP-forming]-like n=1 Tax=Daphnia pulex TaxID=6669 RepID=UPI001EDF4A73|nr:alpha,alpha-trehalose-phosphate synthase [UDP-forming]-like [Daphnia pulex]
MATQATPVLASAPPPSREALIVVSNRLPFVLKRNENGQWVRKASAGGLVTAVAPVVARCNGLWVGWPGIFLEPGEIEPAIPESKEGKCTPTAGLLSKQIVPVFMEKDQFGQFYNGCCNGTFWPLFHSMPDRAIFFAEHWKAYVEVNQFFADKAMAAVDRLVQQDKDVLPLVWVHDYHLTLAAALIRQQAAEKGVHIKLGFFLHIPFPPWDIFRLLPWANQVLEGLLGCDMVGFHIEDYCLNFLDCCQRQLDYRVDKKNFIVEHQGRKISVRPLPIGIPFDKFTRMAEEAPRVVRESKEKIILGVDRLDYTKGLVHRLRAYENLLTKHPEYIEKVIFLQISVPSRTDVKEYQDLKEEMDQVVGKINGQFSTANWSPIRYIYGSISQAELAAFYRDASVCVVTPLRDGMNLVAKEFVACQIEDPGVLILSPFAGAGEMMHEALIVNPYEVDLAAEMIHRALSMSLDERQVRMTHLRKREKLNDVDAWTAAFLKAMDSSLLGVVGAAVCRPGEEVGQMMTTPEDFDRFLSDYLSGGDKLAILLDYDGTLAPIAPHPDMAIIPNETKRVLERLSNCPDVYVAIISGRGVASVKSMVGIENITYAGNHGLEIVHPDGTKFTHPMPSEFEDKVSQLMEKLQDEVCSYGAWVENKGVLLTYHYREAPEDVRDDLVERARFLIKAYGFNCFPALCALEAKPPVEWDKGRAAIYILRTAFGVDWSERIRIVFAGDDVGDEDAIVALKGIGATFRVGSDMEITTAADRRLPNTDVVLALLKWIERFMMHRKPPRFSASMTMVVPINAAGPLVPSYATQPLEAQVEVGQ